MHAGEDLPRVDAAAKMPDVIYEMSRKGLGMAAVTDANGRLLGIITDGDLAPRDAKAQGKRARPESG